MFFTVLFTSLFIPQNVLAASVSSELIKIGDISAQDRAEPDNINIVQDRTATLFPKGIVPYYIDSVSYDSIITSRIQAAMDLIEASSCVVFKKMTFKPANINNSTWVHFTNPMEIRECVHEARKGTAGETVITIGYECMLFRYIVHVVLHSIGFKDEVAHPHRDQYIRIMWENIQPAYRKLFVIQHEDAPYKLVEYDPMSIMHFHDRAFSMNGAPTIAPRVPGLLIQPSEKLSQLDVMKLRLWFGHECNKRKVGALLEKCKTVFHYSPSLLSANNPVINENYNPSVEADGDPDDKYYQQQIKPNMNNDGANSGYSDQEKSYRDVAVGIISEVDADGNHEYEYDNDIDAIEGNGIAYHQNEQYEYKADDGNEYNTNGRDEGVYGEREQLAAKEMEVDDVRRYKKKSI